MAGSTELDGKRAVFMEEQRLLQGWRWGPLLAAVAIMVFVFLPRVGASSPEGGWPALAGILAASVGLMAVLLLPLLKLTVRVTDSHLHVHYFPMRKRSHALGDVSACAVRTYHPLLEYGGWGIRLGRKGWAYTVSGRVGVQLEFKSGRGLLIGSKRASELAEAIRRGMPAK